MFFALNNYYVCPCRDVDLKKLLKERLFIKLALRATSRKVCSVALKTGILYQMDNTFRYIVFYMSVPKFIVFKNVYLDRINCYFCKLRGRGKSKRLSSDSIDSQPNMGFGQLWVRLDKAMISPNYNESNIILSSFSWKYFNMLIQIWHHHRGALAIALNIVMYVFLCNIYWRLHKKPMVLPVLLIINFKCSFSFDLRSSMMPKCSWRSDWIIFSSWKTKRGCRDLFDFRRRVTFCLFLAETHLLLKHSIVCLS